MGQPLRHHLGVDAPQKHECGVDVPELVKAKMGKPSGLDYARPGSPQVRGVHGCPQSIGENQVVVAVGGPQGQPLL